MVNDDWKNLHIRRWQDKKQLRFYYEQEIFNRIQNFINVRQTVVEIGSGPGFLKDHIPQIFSTDIEISPHLNCCADASQLPFADCSVDLYVGIDVLHHFSYPGHFFLSASKSLKHGGKIILIEPWAGPLGYLFYRFVHHEDCQKRTHPFGPAFPEGKSPMDGNAMISRQCLVDQKAELANYGLNVVKNEFFGSLSYLLTGGFQAWAAPLWLIRLLLALENFLPNKIKKLVGFRIMVVLEKV